MLKKIMAYLVCLWFILWLLIVLNSLSGDEASSNWSEESCSSFVLVLCMNIFISQCVIFFNLFVGDLMIMCNWSICLQVGLGSFLLRYVPGLLRSLLVEIGLSEDMYNPVCKFLIANSPSFSLCLSPVIK